MPPKLPFCDYDECKNKNRDTSFVTRDTSGIRVFCEPHWIAISSLFARAKNCALKEWGCWRNHGADLYEDERTSYSVKHCDRYWELCSVHMDLYKKYVPLWLID
mgnify:CR=1 FL=1